MTNVTAGNRDIPWAFGFSFLAAFSILFGIFIYRDRTTVSNPVVLEKISLPSHTPEPSPTLSPVSVIILNGSGKNGEASRIRGLLPITQEMKISVGNAESSTENGILIEYKNTVSETVIAAFIKALSEETLVRSTQSDTLPADIRIIVGK